MADVVWMSPAGGLIGWESWLRVQLAVWLDMRADCEVSWRFDWVEQLLAAQETTS